jgi:hypothetical protein
MEACRKASTYGTRAFCSLQYLCLTGSSCRLRRTSTLSIGADIFLKRDADSFVNASEVKVGDEVENLISELTRNFIEYRGLA